MKPYLLKPSHRLSLWLVSFVLSIVGLLLVVGCESSKPSAPPNSASLPTKFPTDIPLTDIPNRFVGNDACQPCHAVEFKRHAASRHAHTLRIATRD